MADWPTLDDLKLALNVNTTARDSILTPALAAAIDQVKIDTAGTPEGFDDASEGLAVTDSLSQAALLLAVMITKAPDAPYGIAAVFDTGGLRVASRHPTYEALLTGSRYSFGVG
jgi:predicted transcriptional regulator